MEKLKSRKFWLSVAAMLGSIAVSIKGIVTDNKYITTIGVICGVASAAIYAFCEAWVDAKAVGQNALPPIFMGLSDYKDDEDEDDEDDGK